MDAPKRIWVDLLTVDFASNPYDKPAENGPRKCEAEYILAAEHARIVAEKDAEIERLQDAARPFSQPVIRNGIEVDLQVTVDQVFALRAALKGDDNECSGEGAPLWRTG